MDANENASRYSDTMRACKTLGELEKTVAVIAELIKKLPEENQAWLRDEYRSIKNDLEANEKPD